MIPLQMFMPDRPAHATRLKRNQRYVPLRSEDGDGLVMNSLPSISLPLPAPVQQSKTTLRNEEAYKTGGRYAASHSVASEACEDGDALVQHSDDGEQETKTLSAKKRKKKKDGAVKKFFKKKYNPVKKFFKKKYKWYTEDENAFKICMPVYTIFVWLCFLGHLLSSFIGPAGDFGLRTIRDSDNIWSLRMFNFFLITTPFNILSAIIILSSNYVRRCVLAPRACDVDNALKKGHEIGIGYQSLASWFRAPLLREILWLVLVLTSLPIHLLYNSVILSAERSYDAYEIMVSEKFFDGEPFDLSILNATQFADQVGAPVPFGTHFPSHWPGVPELQHSLESVQAEPSMWLNRSNSDCRSYYGTKIYRTFRTVIMVTNWTESLPPSNSALAIGALPGQPSDGIPDRFMSLCPAAYLAVTPDSFVPNTTAYISLSDEHQCSGGGPQPSLCMIDYAAIDASQDLCFYYRPEGLDDPTLSWTVSNELALSYCLSEPMSGTNSRLVFSRLITQILTVTIGMKAVAMTIACLCVKSPPLLDRYKSKLPSDTAQVMKDGEITGAEIWSWSITMSAILIWLIVLYFEGLGVFGRGATPSSLWDWTFILNIVIYQNAIHVIFVVREYIERNRRDRGKKKGSSRWKFPVFMFCWNLLQHQLASAWLGVSLVDHHPLGSIAGDESSVPTMFLSSLFHGDIGMKPLESAPTGIGVAMVMIFIVYVVFQVAYACNLPW